MARLFYPIKLYVKNLPNAVFLIGSIIVNIGTWSWLLWYIRPQQEAIFLHYNILFGVDYIGEWWRVFFIPLAGLGIFFINGILGWVFFQKDSFISHLFNAGSFLCQISLLVTAALLVFLNS